MKWGEHNLETQFKYGEIEVSPAAMMAAGNKVSASYRIEMANKLMKGEINQADYKKALLENLAANAKAKKDEPVKSTGTNVSESTADLRQQLLDGKITMAQYRELTKNGTSKDSEQSKQEDKAENKTEPRQSRNFLQEALDKAREKKQEEQEEEKEEKEKTTREKASTSSSRSSGSGSSRGSSSEPRATSGKTEKEEKEKEYEEDVDEGPMDYQKSKFFENLNRASKSSGTQVQRSKSGHNSNLAVKKHGRSLKKRLYHSEMVHDLKERFHDER